jgi:primosomal protein N' (replication factor Y)
MQLVHLAQEEMIIQTFSPTHPALVALAKQDAAKFYRDELAARARFGYPPFRPLVNLIVTGADSQRVRDMAQQFASDLADHADVLGPSPAPLARIRGRYRWQVLVKEREDGAARRRVAELLMTTRLPRNVKLTVDVDPVDLL